MSLRSWRQLVPSSTRWLWLLPALGAGLWWSKGHIVRILMCVAYAVAFMLTGLAGSLVQAFLDRGQERTGPRPGIFQLLWLGQYLLFALVIAVGLPAALFSQITGWHLPLRFSLPLVLLGLVYVAQRDRRASTPQAKPGWQLQVPGVESFVLAGVIALAFFRALSLHSAHAGGLGHDTHQHIHWTQHIVDFGYFPLAARGTNLLEDYPRFFHILTAGWTSAGVFGLVGPHVKLMPFLQAMLACGFFCELVLAAKPRVEKGWILAPVLLGAFVSWHLTMGAGHEIYRVPQLSSTPRMSAGWVVFAFPLLALAQRVGTVPDMRHRLVLFAPLFLFLSIGINPSTTLAFLTFGLPLTFIFYLVTRERGLPRLLGALKLALWGTLVALPLLFANGLVLGEAAKWKPIALVLSWLDLRTTIRGLSVEPFDVRPGPPPPLCEIDGPSCAIDLVSHWIADGVRAYGDTLSAGDLPAISTDGKGVWYLLMFGAPLLALAITTRKDDARSLLTSPRSSRIFLGLLAACLLTPVFISIASAALLRMQERGDSWHLLSHYYRSYSIYLGPWFQCVLAVSSWMLVPPVVLPPGIFAGTTAGTVALLAYQLNALSVPALTTREYASGHWRIDWAELRAIDHLNEFVPADEAVLIPGWWWHKGTENVLSVADPEGMIAPLMTARLLFAVRMGAGKDYSWRDLQQRFCATPEARRKLLREANVHWVLLRDPKVRQRALFDSYHWVCGVTLAELGAEFPPAWSERDLGLFRINP